MLLAGEHLAWEGQWAQWSLCLELRMQWSRWLSGDEPPALPWPPAEVLKKPIKHRVQGSCTWGSGVIQGALQAPYLWGHSKGGGNSNFTRGCPGRQGRDQASFLPLCKASFKQRPRHYGKPRKLASRMGEMQPKCPRWAKKRTSPGHKSLWWDPSPCHVSPKRDPLATVYPDYGKADPGPRLRPQNSPFPALGSAWASICVQPHGSRWCGTTEAHRYLPKAATVSAVAAAGGVQRAPRRVRAAPRARVPSHRSWKKIAAFSIPT